MTTEISVMYGSEKGKTTNEKRPFECCYVNKIMTPSEHNLNELCLNTAVVIEMVCVT